MRGFFAIELPRAVRERLTAVQAELRARLPGRALRWSRPESLHVTLKFLGEVEDPGAVLAAARALPSPGPLRLDLGPLGSFGGRSPRVLWAGLAGPDAEALVPLHASLEAALAPLGFAPDDRPYRAHVTLARAARGSRLKPRATRSALAEVSAEPSPFTAGGLVLFESSYGEGGPVRYIPRGRWDFAEPR